MRPARKRRAAGDSASQAPANNDAGETIAWRRSRRPLPTAVHGRVAKACFANGPARRLAVSHRAGLARPLQRRRPRAATGEPQMAIRLEHRWLRRALAGVAVLTLAGC